MVRRSPLMHAGIWTPRPIPLRCWVQAEMFHLGMSVQLLFFLRVCRCSLGSGALWRTSGPNGLSAKCNAARDQVWGAGGTVKCHSWFIRGGTYLYGLTPHSLLFRPTRAWGTSTCTASSAPRASSTSRAAAWSSPRASPFPETQCECRVSGVPGRAHCFSDLSPSIACSSRKASPTAATPARASSVGLPQCVQYGRDHTPALHICEPPPCTCILSRSALTPCWTFPTESDWLPLGLIDHSSLSLSLPGFLIPPHRFDACSDYRFWYYMNRADVQVGPLTGGPGPGTDPDSLISLTPCSGTT